MYDQHVYAYQRRKLLLALRYLRKDKNPDSFRRRSIWDLQHTLVTLRKTKGRPFSNDNHPRKHKRVVNKDRQLALFNFK